MAVLSKALLFGHQVAFHGRKCGNNSSIILPEIRKSIVK
jgi:hypothetical protein